MSTATWRKAQICVLGHHPHYPRRHVSLEAPGVQRVPKGWKKFGLGDSETAHVFFPSIGRLARMVAENGHLVVNDEGIWRKPRDGSPLQFTDSIRRKSSPHRYFARGLAYLAQSRAYF